MEEELKFLKNNEVKLFSRIGNATKHQYDVMNFSGMTYKTRSRTKPKYHKFNKTSKQKIIITKDLY